MKIPTAIHAGRIRHLQFKAKTTSTRYLSQQLPRDGSISKNNESDSSEGAQAQTAVPAVVRQPEKTDGSTLLKLFQHVQNILEETSGFVELVHLKKGVQEASDKFDGATEQVAERRKKLQEAQKAHDVAHKKHVSLLMRRDEWSGEDAQSFVNITSEEVQTRQELLEAQEALKQAEDHAIQCQHIYMDVMRQRYHEEQMWQDKWRLVGTYGTWSLIGLNSLVFLAGQYRAEKREIKRLQHMEEVMLRSQKEHADSMAAFQSQVSQDIEGISTTASQNSAGVPMEEKMTNGEDRTETEKREAMTRTGDIGEASILTNVTKDFPELPDVPVHLPSVAIGAVVSATCVILLSLVARR